MCMLAACPWLPTRVNAGGSALLPGYTRRPIRSGNSVLRSLSLSREVPFAVLLSSLPHPGDCVHSRPGEQASETPSVEILHRETGDKVFGERLDATARCCSCSSSPDRLLHRQIRLHHGRHQQLPWWCWCCCWCDLPGRDVRAFPLLPCTATCSMFRSDACMCVVKYACASVMLISVIKLTRKLPNNPTITG